jgi:3-oxoacyl-[acyl-carrier protein] reductase
VRLSRAAWPHLQKTRRGIVNIAGIGGIAGSAEFAIGGSVNAAMLNLTKCQADRGVADGVRVNAINPGAIATDRLTLRIRRLAGELSISDEAAARQMAEQMQSDRFGEPDEIASAVAFLASCRVSTFRVSS